MCGVRRDDAPREPAGVARSCYPERNPVCQRQAGWVAQRWSEGLLAVPACVLGDEKLAVGACIQLALRGPVRRAVFGRVHRYLRVCRGECTRSAFAVRVDALTDGVVGDLRGLEMVATSGVGSVQRDPAAPDGQARVANRRAWAGRHLVG